MFKLLNPLTFANYSPSSLPDLLAHHYTCIFLYLGLQSHSLCSSATVPQPMLHQLFGTDSRKTSGSLLIFFLTHLSISPIIRLLYPLLHSTHDWRPNSLTYPIPILLLRHNTSAITTDCNRSPTLSPRLDILRFWPGTEKKREVLQLRTWFGIQRWWISWSPWRGYCRHMDAEKFLEIHVTLQYDSVPLVPSKARNCPFHAVWCHGFNEVQLNGWLS